MGQESLGLGVNPGPEAPGSENVAKQLEKRLQGATGQQNPAFLHLQFSLVYPPVPHCLGFTTPPQLRLVPSPHFPIMVVHKS